MEREIEIPQEKILKRLWVTSDKLYLVATGKKERLFGKPIGADLISIGGLKAEIRKELAKAREEGRGEGRREMHKMHKELSKLNKPLERIPEETKLTKAHMEVITMLENMLKDNDKMRKKLQKGRLMTENEIVEFDRQLASPSLQGGKREEVKIELKLKDDAKFYTKKDLDKARKDGYEQGFEDGLQDIRKIGREK